MTDRLDAIAAGLRDGRYDCRVPGDTDDVRWLVGEVRRLRETQFCGYCGWQKASSSWADLQAHIRECKQHPLRQAESALTALRARHAEAVEAWGCYYKDKLFAVSLDEASARHGFHDVRPVLIVASEAKARLT